MDETVPGQLYEIMSRLDKGDRRMDEADIARTRMTAKLDAVATSVDENTAITSEVRDYLVAGRVGRKVLIWVGGIVGAIGTIWVAAHQIISTGIHPK